MAYAHGRAMVNEGQSGTDPRPPRAVSFARPSPRKLSGLGRGKPPRKLTALVGPHRRETRQLFLRSDSAPFRPSPAHKTKNARACARLMLHSDSATLRKTAETREGQSGPGPAPD